MRTRYQNKLKQLSEELIQMGSLVEELLQTTMKALMEQNLELAKEVYHMDDKIDEMELKLEKECLELIALQQPMVRDLRLVGNILKIITDLERMGDHAVNIASVTLKIGKEPFIKPLIDLPKMANLTAKMVRKSLEAFTNLDLDLSREVAHDDDEVDALYEQVYTDLIDMMIKQKAIIPQATQLIFVGRYLERIADHATNIGERVIFIETGEKVEIN